MCSAYVCVMGICGGWLHWLEITDLTALLAWQVDVTYPVT